MFLRKAQGRGFCVLYDVILEIMMEQIEVCLQTAVDLLPLEVNQYDMEHHADTRNSNSDSLSR